MKTEEIIQRLRCVHLQTVTNTCYRNWPCSTMDNSSAPSPHPRFAVWIVGPFDRLKCACVFCVNSSHLVSANQLVGVGKAGHQPSLLEPIDGSERAREEDSLHRRKGHNPLRWGQEVSKLQLRTANGRLLRESFIRIWFKMFSLSYLCTRSFVYYFFGLLAQGFGLFLLKCWLWWRYEDRRVEQSTDLLVIPVQLLVMCLLFL